jgi:hypothetical protein
VASRPRRWHDGAPTGARIRRSSGWARPARMHLTLGGFVAQHHARCRRGDAPWLAAAPEGRKLDRQRPASGECRLRRAVLGAVEARCRSAPAAYASASPAALHGCNDSPPDRPTVPVQRNHREHPSAEIDTNRLGPLMRLDVRVYISVSCAPSAGIISYQRGLRDPFGPSCPLQGPRLPCLMSTIIGQLDDHLG